MTSSLNGRPLAEFRIPAKWLDRIYELAEPFDLSLPTVSRHIDALKDAGLIVRHRRAQWRRCEFKREPLIAANEWISRYVAFWEGRIDALVKLVEEPHPKDGNDPSADRDRRVMKV